MHKYSGHLEMWEAQELMRLVYAEIGASYRISTLQIIGPILHQMLTATDEIYLIAVSSSRPSALHKPY